MVPREVRAGGESAPRCGDEIVEDFVAAQVLKCESVHEAHEVDQSGDEEVAALVGGIPRCFGSASPTAGHAVERREHHHGVRPLGTHPLHVRSRLHETRQRVVGAQDDEEADDEGVDLERVGCPNALTMSDFKSSEAWSAVVMETLSTAKGIVRGKGLPCTRKMSGRPQYFLA